MLSCGHWGTGSEWNFISCLFISGGKLYFSTLKSDGRSWNAPEQLYSGEVQPGLRTYSLFDSHRRSSGADADYHEFSIRAAGFAKTGSRAGRPFAVGYTMKSSGEVVPALALDCRGAADPGLVMMGRNIGLCLKDGQVALWGPWADIQKVSIGSYRKILGSFNCGYQRPLPVPGGRQQQDGTPVAGELMERRLEAE
ncbi:hypothetical protein ACIRVF_30130 [Kitasatospora sp. NPDC101157]|uniref:hypothetical protein n=1 Tax=Kitasatospora sp. NPDC101157 TaxID=3364098 RepID=UPI00381FCC3F